LLVTDLAASRLHAELRVDEGIWFVRDLGSRNGTVLNGLKLAPYQPKALQAGDQIKIANRLFMFCLANAELEVNRVEYAHTDFN
jgi:pSer/pThr/pTyr-binding forkhead associated (FHA) protein